MEVNSENEVKKEKDWKPLYGSSDDLNQRGFCAMDVLGRTFTKDWRTRPVIVMMNSCD